VRGLGRVADAPRWLVWGTRTLARGGYDLVKLFRGGEIAGAIEPWMRVDDVGAVPFDAIAAEGMRAVLFDLENTIIPPGGPFDAFGRGVISKAKDAGLLVGVVSNASAGWVKPALDAEGIFGIAPAGKPAPSAFIEACTALGVKPEEAAYVGDQVITDVLGSQRAGLRAVLVKPKYSKEFRSAKFQRLVARIVIRLAGKSDKESV
jgi:HAD superfamily phosphatase (TIGR01668 family)